jgi:leucyl aminopeptidase
MVNFNIYFLNELYPLNKLSRSQIKKYVNKSSAFINGKTKSSSLDLPKELYNSYSENTNVFSSQNILNLIKIKILDTENKIIRSPDEKLNNSDINSIKIKIYVKNKPIFYINNNINKINNIIKLYKHIDFGEKTSLNQEFTINIIFDQTIDLIIKKAIITRLNNLFYDYQSDIKKKIKFHNIVDSGKNLMNELFTYKDIIMDPNKNPDTYLKYIKANIPKNYIFKYTTINTSNLFPLSKAIGAGSKYKSYFVHIYPKKINNNKKSIYLVGKGITFDSGGMNLKLGDFSNMKTDMTGSALILSTLNLLVKNKVDTKFNIHIVASIVENMIDNMATRPGMVIKALNGKTIEIVNTDAEGRLCIIDNINYLNKYIIKNPNCLLINVATLTGNATQITGTVSSIATSNDQGYHYLTKLISIGEKIEEYVDYLKIHKEYYEYLGSTVADIKSTNYKFRADCILAATFISSFINNEIPWIHIDLGSVCYTNSVVQSYGLQLLYEFISSL